MFQKHKSFLIVSVCIASTILTSACRTPSTTKADASAGSPEFKVAALFSDNMVLQQQATVPVWGWAANGQTITVNFGNQKVSTKAKDGKWMVKLHNLKASETPGVLAISVSGANSLQFTNVLVGEVWLASGQSNMEFALGGSFQSKADVASATNKLIRFFKVPNVTSDKPTTNVNAKWELSSPESAAGFSAVAYYFGRDLQQARHVPIGLIQSDWGGTPAESWMSREKLEANPRYQKEILDASLMSEANFKKALAAYEVEKAEAVKQNKEFKKAAPRGPWKPTVLYNAMIAPLVPYSFKGAIWYQGESNAGRAEQYHSLFPDMIKNWRSDWKSEFPFLLVQLAPFKAIKDQPDNSDWAELREAQLRSTQILPKVGIAVITDVGEERDIHPNKKGPVGLRLALAARKIAYGENIPYSGPIFKSMKIKDGQAILSFDFVGSGLEARDGALKGFSICGADKKFVWAIAEIQPDNTIIVSSPNVTEPVAVRYGWADYPVVNLWNRDGLPASPFRTDDFPMITAPKK